MAKMYCHATRIGKLISKSGSFPCLLDCQLSARLLGLLLILHGFINGMLRIL
jgi:hypothetical protein